MNCFSGQGFARLFHHFYQQTLSAEAIAERYYQGDRQAQEHTARFRALLAVCLGNLLTLIDPHRWCWAADYPISMRFMTGWRSR